MDLTDYHAKYYAFQLTRRCSSDDIGKLAGALVDARVDLNPHQVDAALFAFRSPLSRGALLADEVGLGKTIEAGLVISQKWAERKRRILVITPANLRKQWHQELHEKFFLPSRILEAKSFNDLVRSGQQPFDSSESIAICSYQFAKNKELEISATRWDVVVVDEAHRLRNVYKPSNVIANVLKAALKAAPKLLLTATPLQNSLLELFGLVSFIDEFVFGDLASFRDQFTRLTDDESFVALRARLQPICHRTLRRQVVAYVPYTKRHALVQPFTPEDSEDRLYNLVSEYLRRDNLQALPSAQRSLMTMVLRKLLASSSFAIAGALETMSRRLQARLGAKSVAEAVEDTLARDYESLQETADEWPPDIDTHAPFNEADNAALRQEIADLEHFRSLATSITHNAKGRALIVALERGFAAAERLGAPRKAIVFTESRRTQEYLLRVLADTPLSDRLVLFNGSNSDPRSRRIYSEWLLRNQGTDHITGSRTADMRSALVDYFREQGELMIATEAGAEGINLQFCSLVVNYDLPWNPQRIEQRIGRCHRYGQKHDVVVVNFLNQKNEADQRVFRLLSEKFALFDGVFGASDEVLGAIESGVDFEKRIGEIYQRCRTPEDIESAFDQLQEQFSSQISEAMTRTRRMLLEHFDEEVHEKLRISLRDSQAYLNRYERWLMDITRHELADVAAFDNGHPAFQLRSNPYRESAEDIPLGSYVLPRHGSEAHLYRLGHPLAERVVQTAKERPTPAAAVTFDLSGSEVQIAALQPYIGNRGALSVSQITVESLDQAEDYVLVAAATSDGQILEESTAMRLFSLPAKAIRPLPPGWHPEQLILDLMAHRQSDIQQMIARRNAGFVESEAERLDGWADDRKSALERDLKELDQQIRETRRVVSAALSLDEKLEGQKRIRALESQRSAKRRALFEAQDEVDSQRNALIGQIEQKLTQRVTVTDVLSIGWELI